MFSVSHSFRAERVWYLMIEIIGSESGSYGGNGIVVMVLDVLIVTVEGMEGVCALVTSSQLVFALANQYV